MSKRQNIVDALTTLLQGITTNNTYSLNIGTKVYPWRKNVIEEAECPCIVLWDLDAVISESTEIIGLDSWDLNISIVVFFSQSTSATIARGAISDVVKIIGADPYLGGLLEMPIQILGHELGLEQRSSAVGMARISIITTYSTQQYQI
jgi:hypothetical protein